MADEWKVDLESGNWFGHGGTRIGREDSFAAAYSTYGPRKRTIAKAVGLPTVAYLGKRWYQTAFGRKEEEGNKRVKRAPPYSPPGRGRLDHLSKMRGRARTIRGRRRGKSVRRRMPRKRRRVATRVVKRSRKQSWATAVVKGSKPITYSYLAKGGIQGTSDKTLLFVPQFDAFNRCNSASLGTGVNYGNFTIATPEQYPSCTEESPQLMFAWAAQNSLNDEQEQRRKYIWGPRTYTWEFVNQELFPMELKIYWVKPRRDIDYDTTPYNASTKLNYNQGTDMNEVLCRCLLRDGQLGNATGVLRNDLTSAFDLFKSTSFCQLFNVVKVNKMKVDSGKCVKIMHKLNRYRSISDLDFGDLNNVATRSTLIPIIASVGCPVYDNTNVAKVGTGAVALTWTFKVNFQFWTMNSNTQQSVATDLAAPAGAVIPAQAVYVSKPASVIVSAAP